MLYVSYMSINMEKKKAMAPHSSTLAWKIPWTEEPGRLQSMGSPKVGRDWVTSLSLSCTGEGNGNPLQCSCLENPSDGGVWWAAVYRVAQSRTRLKWLSSSSSKCGKMFTYLKKMLNQQKRHPNGKLIYGKRLLVAIYEGSNNKLNAS